MTAATAVTVEPTKPMFTEGDQIARFEWKIKDGVLVLEFLIWNTATSKMRTIQTGIGHLVEVR